MRRLAAAVSSAGSFSSPRPPAPPVAGFEAVVAQCERSISRWRSSSATCDSCWRRSECRRSARHLPLDVKARTAGDALEGGCHALMHEVGRRFAREHHVTLSTLHPALERSDLLGRLRDGPGEALAATAPTGRRLGSARDLPAPADGRCAHGPHALMRGFHGDLGLTVGVPEAPASTRRLRPGCFPRLLDRLRAPTAREAARVATSPRSVCNGRFFFVRCWYRYFLEQPGRPAPETPADVVRCGGLRPLQRSGRVAAVAVTIDGDALHRRLPAPSCRRCNELPPRRRGAGARGTAGRPAAPPVLVRPVSRRKRRLLLVSRTLAT